MFFNFSQDWLSTRTVEDTKFGTFSPSEKKSFIELKLKIFPYVTNHRHCFLPIKLTAQATNKKALKQFPFVYTGTHEITR